MTKNIASPPPEGSPEKSCDEASETPPIKNNTPGINIIRTITIDAKIENRIVLNGIPVHF